MYASKQIIYSIESGENLITMENCELTKEVENSKSIKEVILKLFLMNNDKLKRMKKNGKECVTVNLSYETLTKKYKDIM